MAGAGVVGKVTSPPQTPTIVNTPFPAGCPSPSRPSSSAEPITSPPHQTLTAEARSVRSVVKAEWPLVPQCSPSVTASSHTYTLTSTGVPHSRALVGFCLSSGLLSVPSYSFQDTLCPWECQAGEPLITGQIKMLRTKMGLSG